MSDFTLHKITPTNHPAAERLTFTVEIPAGWTRLAPPDEPVDFSEPDKFLPLALFMTQTGPAFFSAAARPAFDDGAVSQWVDFMCEKQGLTVTERARIETRWCPALLVEATQPQEDGSTMTMRVVMLEDGGALVQFAVFAPTGLFPSLEASLMHTLASVVLLDPQGPTHPLVPGESVPKQRQRVPKESLSGDGPETFSDFVRPDNLSALDESHPVTANLREGGVGLVPRVHTVNEANGYATTAPAAVGCFFKIPLGWHAVDDGRRTLVFDKGSGGAQINFNVTEAADPDVIFDAIQEEVTAGQPAAQTMRQRIDGIPLLGIQNLTIDGENLMQYYFLQKHPLHENMLIRVRVTTPPDRYVDVLNMTGLILKSVGGSPS